jgi:hypothetical protein
MPHYATESPKVGDYVLEPSFPQGSITADGWRILRRTEASSDEVVREKDRLTAIATARRLAADAGTTAWTYELDNSHLRL